MRVPLLLSFALSIFFSFGLFAQDEQAERARQQHYSDASRAARAGDLPAALAAVDRAHAVALEAGLADEIMLAHERAHRRLVVAREAHGRDRALPYLEAYVELMRRDGQQTPMADQAARNLGAIYGELKRPADSIRAYETAVVLGIAFAARGPGKPRKDDTRDETERTRRLDWSVSLSLEQLFKARAGEQDRWETTKALYDRLAAPHAFSERRRLEHLSDLMSQAFPSEEIWATYRRLLDLQKKAYGAKSMVLHGTLGKMSWIARRRGEEDEHRRLVEERIAIFEEEGRRRPEGAARRHDEIASLYSRELADPESAERHYRLAIELERKRPWRRFASRRSTLPIARAYRQNDKTEKAIAVLEAALAETQARWEIPAPGTATVLALYRQAWTDYDEAGRLLRLALKSLEAEDVPLDRGFLEGLGMLDPKSLLSKRRRDVLGQSSSTMSLEAARVIVMHALADLALVTGRHGEADAWLRKAIALEESREGTKRTSLAFLHAARAEAAALAGDLEKWTTLRSEAVALSSEVMPFLSRRCALAAHTKDLIANYRSVRAHSAAWAFRPAIEAAYGPDNSCTRALVAAIREDLPQPR